MSSTQLGAFTPSQKTALLTALGATDYATLFG
jgi:hypothetical protein